MSDRAAQIVVFAVIYLMLMNALAIVLYQVGFFEEMGIIIELDAGDSFQDARDEFEDIDLRGGLADTLFGIYNTVAKTVNFFLEAVTAGPDLLNQLGVPRSITGPFEMVLVVLSGLALIYYASGR